MLFAFSTLAILLIGLGWTFRYHPKRHIPLMLSAFLVDIGVLLYIEVTRHAIHTLEESLHTPASKALLLFHVAVSLLMVLLYVAQIGSGIWLYRVPGPQIRNFHRYSALTFVTCRLLNYITSFFVGQS
jgi:hypothetical protein